MSFRNVNNWHWVERDCTKWAQGYLKEHLNSEIDDIKILEITDIEGDALVSQRKGKIMAIYDLSVNARVSQGNTQFEAKIDLCSESCGDDPVVHLFPSNSDVSKRISKQMIILSKKFGEDMIESHKSALGTNTYVANPATNQNTTSMALNDSVTASNRPSFTKKGLSVTLPVDLTQIHDLLVKPDLIMRWSSGTLRIDSGAYSLYDELISFTYSSVSESSIEMSWKLKEWTSNGKLTIHIEPSGNYSKITMSLSDIPSDFAAKAEQFFDLYYWQPIKRMLGIF